MEARLMNAPCGYLSLDQDSYLTKANKTFLKEMGYQEEEVIGKHIENLLRPGNKMIFHSYFYPSIHSQGEVNELFIKLMNAEGVEVPFLMNAHQYEEKSEKFVDCILLPIRKRIEYETQMRVAQKQMEEAYAEKEKALMKLKDIHKEIEERQEYLLKMNTKLMNQANTDALTGIPNRRLFEIKLNDQVERYQEEGIPFSLLMIDIDHFKYINDTYGHPSGDRVLVKIAQLIQEHIPVESMIARYGGEEFIIILPYVDEQEAVTLALEINELVEQTKCHRTHPVTVSIGVATFLEEDSADSIIKKSDTALYQSKNSGRNQMTAFEQSYK